MANRWQILDIAQIRDKANDNTHHGHNLTPAGGYLVRPGRGRCAVLDPSTASPIANATNLWADPSSYNWTWANRSGIKLCSSVNGRFAPNNWGIATPIYVNGQWLVRIDGAHPGVGSVVHVRGVYPVNYEFAWDNYWADCYISEPVNYYFGFINYNDRTDIILAGYPGSGQVQLWYAYNSGIESSQYQALNIWPYPKDWQNISMWAVDKVLELYNLLWQEEKYTGLSTFVERQYLWDQYVDYTPERIPPLILDNFNRTEFERGNSVLFRNSTRGNTYLVFRDFGIKRLADNTPALNFRAYLSAADAAWAGYYLGVSDLSRSPWDTLKSGSIRIVYRGSGKGARGRLFLQLNRARWYDEDKYDNPAYIYTHPLPEWISDWTEIAVDYKQFWRHDNIYYDPDRIAGNTWAYCGTGPLAVTEWFEPFAANNERYYTSVGVKWSGQAGNWVLLGVSGQQFDLADHNSFNFLFYTNHRQTLIQSEFGPKPYKIEVFQEGDSSPRIYYWEVGSDEVGIWIRKTINFTDFSPAIDTSKKINYIQFLELSYGLTGTDQYFRLTDIKFGAHHTFHDEAEALYLIQFYADGRMSTQYNSWIKEISFGPNASDPYPHTAPLGITVNRYGLSNWQGPTLSHYQSPLSPWIAGASAIRDTFLSFLVDAQDTYYSRYKGIKGPIMPMHTRNFLENCWYVNDLDFNRWSWFPNYPNRNRVAAWPFNGDRTDIDGGHNLSFSGTGESYTSGICQPGNTAWTNDGSDRYPYFSPGTDFLFQDQDFTVEVVARFTVVGTGTDCLASIWQGGSPGQRSWVVYRSGNSLVFTYSADGVNFQTVAGGGITAANIYYHLVVSRRQGVLRLFVNGEKKREQQVTARFFDSAAPLAIGKSMTGWPANLNGAIDWLAIYKRGMTDAEITDRYNYIIGNRIYSSYPECAYGYAQYWTLAKAAEYYYFTGDTVIENWLGNWYNWITAYYRSDSKDVPTWFHDYGFGYGNYDPYIMEAVARFLLFYYWRTGNGYSILRDILTDLRTNRYDSNYGGYVHDNLHWGYGNGYLTRLWGLVVNGRPPGAVNPPPSWYDIAPTQDDINHFISIVNDYWFGHVGDSNPNTLNSQLIPYVFAEDYNSWQFAPHYIYVSGLGTTESLVNVAAGALEWGRYSGDYSWYYRLIWYLLQKDMRICDWTMAGWLYMRELASSTINLISAGDYSVQLHNNSIRFAVRYGNVWYATNTTPQLSPGLWWHVAVVYTRGSAKIYLNAKEVTSTTSLPYPPDRDYNYLRLYGPFDLQSLRLFSYPLTAGDIYWLYNLDARIESQVRLLFVEFWPPSRSGPLCFTSAASNTLITTREWYDLEIISSRVYYTMGFDKSEIVRSMEQSTQTVTIRSQLPAEVISLLTSNDFRGTTVVIKETIQGLDPANPDNFLITFVGYVDNWQVSNQIISLDCRDRPLIWDLEWPRRRYSYFCGHTFRGPVCGYLGTVMRCDKTRTFCISLNNVSNFGGFPNTPKMMRGKV